jgi:hypothetical protein
MNNDLKQAAIIGISIIIGLCILASTYYERKIVDTKIKFIKLTSEVCNKGSESNPVTGYFTCK